MFSSIVCFWSRFYIVILGMFFVFFFISVHLLSIFYLDFYFPFLFGLLFSFSCFDFLFFLFYLDLYFFYRTFLSFWTFISLLDLYFPFRINRDLIFDFFQVFLTQCVCLSPLLRLGKLMNLGRFCFVFFVNFAL